MSAWLTRHRDLCRLFNFMPFDFITELAHAFVKQKLLQAHMVPDFGEVEDTGALHLNAKSSKTLPTQVPDGRDNVQTVDEGADPAAKSSDEGNACLENPPQLSDMDNMLTPAAKSMSSRLSTPQTTEYDKDVEMAEGDATMLAESSHKGKEKAILIPGVVQTPRPEPPQNRTIPAKTSKKAKRGLSSSPSKPDGPSTSTKRLRTATTTVSHMGINPTVGIERERGLFAAGIKLGGLTMAEGDAVDAQIVPQVVGAKCERCSERRKLRERCIPTCNKKCTFEGEDFGVGVWPQVTLLQVEKEKGKKGAQSKRKERGTTDSAIGRRGNVCQTRTRRATNMLHPLQNTGSLLSTRSHTKATGGLHEPLDSTAVPAAATSQAAGADPAGSSSVTIFYADLLPFAAAAADEDHSIFELQLLRNEVRAVLLREWNAVSEAVETSTDRRLIGADILAVLNEAIVDEGGSALYEPWELVCKADNLSGESYDEDSDTSDSDYSPGKGSVDG
ncbi:hypothetical protein BJ322DRAFT_1114157 [Thelephora terrestris]|uniref:Uncharacterized protein n=1 Tax=Thelephora terrestris TaxID=56493 RepID=A0A9P6H4I3_9AGAM|nr:hypothetical protein BJ322DRAFT_1114157 [Thelephora terrestris]